MNELSHGHTAADIANLTINDRDKLFEDSFMRLFHLIYPEKTEEYLDNHRVGDLKYVTMYDLLKNIIRLKITIEITSLACLIFVLTPVFNDFFLFFFYDEEGERTERERRDSGEIGERENGKKKFVKAWVIKMFVTKLESGKGQEGCLHTQGSIL